MKMVSIREFRDHATEHFRSEEPIIVMRGSKPAGVFLPWDESMLPVQDMQRLLYAQWARKMQQHMESVGATEKEVLADLEAIEKIDIDVHG